jgi:predicted nucleic acid-binding protein
VLTFDSNVLVYANDSRADAAKRRQAQAILRHCGLAGNAALTMQALGEFVQAARRKSLLPVPDIVARIENWRSVFPVLEPAVGDIDAALQLVSRYDLQPWDAMMLATASRHGVRWLVTEDMQDGFVARGVTLIDPFRPANADKLQEIGLA